MSEYKIRGLPEPSELKPSGIWGQRLTTDKLAAEKVLAEKIAAAKVIADKLAADKIIAEKLAAERLAAKKLAADKLAAKKLAEKLVADKLAEKLVADKLAAEKILAEKLAAEKILSDKLEAEKLLAEKLLAEKLTANKIVAEKVVTKHELLKTLEEPFTDIIYSGKQYLDYFVALLFNEYIFKFPDTKIYMKGGSVYNLYAKHLNKDIIYPRSIDYDISLHISPQYNLKEIIKQFYAELPIYIISIYNILKAYLNTNFEEISPQYKNTITSSVIVSKETIILAYQKILVTIYYDDKYPNFSIRISLQKNNTLIRIVDMLITQELTKIKPYMIMINNKDIVIPQQLSSLSPIQNPLKKLYVLVPRVDYLIILTLKAIINRCTTINSEKCKKDYYRLKQFFKILQNINSDSALIIGYTRKELYDIFNYFSHVLKPKDNTFAIKFQGFYEGKGNITNISIIKDLLLKLLDSKDIQKDIEYINIEIEKISCNIKKNQQKINELQQKALKRNPLQIINPLTKETIESNKYLIKYMKYKQKYHQLKIDLFS